MNRGDVVLVHVPFVGATGAKTRPALVLQSDDLNKILRETIIAEITSNLANVSRPQQKLIDIATPAGAATGLLMNSAVRCDRLHTIPQRDVQRVIGKLAGADLNEIEACLKAALGIP